MALDCVFSSVHFVSILTIKANGCTISQLYLVKNSIYFEQIYSPSSGVSTLYTQQQVLVMLVMLTNTFCCEYSIKTPDDRQQICPKHVEFFIKYIWEIVHHVGFYYNNISRRTVLWMSNFVFTHWPTSHWSLCITDDTIVELHDILLLLTCKAISVQPCISSERSRRLSPRFQYNHHMKMESLLAQRTGRFYPPGNIPGTHFYERLIQP